MVLGFDSHVCEALGMAYRSDDAFAYEDISPKYPKAKESYLGKVIIDLWNMVFVAQGDFNAGDISCAYTTARMVILGLTKSSIRGKLKTLFVSSDNPLAKEIRKIARNTIYILHRIVNVMETIYPDDFISDLQRLQPLVTKSSFLFPDFKPLINALKDKGREFSFLAQQRMDLDSPLTLPHT